jgi:hypothetical protein
MTESGNIGYLGARMNSKWLTTILFQDRRKLDKLVLVSQRI